MANLSRKKSLKYLLYFQFNISYSFFGFFLKICLKFVKFLFELFQISKGSGGEEKEEEVEDYLLLDQVRFGRML